MLRIILDAAVVRHMEISEDAISVEDAISLEVSGKIVEISIATTTHKIQIGLITTSSNWYNPYN